MNNLSWLLYAADVADNLDWFFFLIMLGGIIGGFIWTMAGFGMSDCGTEDKYWRTWRKIGYAVLAPAFVFGVIFGSLIPGKNTVYAIAASEMGEKAINTQTGGKAIKALDAWLDKQIGDEPSAKADTAAKKDD